jgi:hypothetical protein
MQNYDAVQTASIKRSQAYLHAKEHDAWIIKENRQDLITNILFITTFAVSVAVLVAYALGA